MHRVQLQISCALMLSIWAVNGIALADIRCPEPESSEIHAIEKAPTEIFSITRLPEGDSHEYIFTIDQYYEDLELLVVDIQYGSDDQQLLVADVQWHPQLDRGVIGSVVVHPSIVENVRLVWVYFEKGKSCPRRRAFWHQLAD